MLPHVCVMYVHPGRVGGVMIAYRLLGCNIYMEVINEVCILMWVGGAVHLGVMMALCHFGSRVHRALGIFFSRPPLFLDKI